MRVRLLVAVTTCIALAGCGGTTADAPPATPPTAAPPTSAAPATSAPASPAPASPTTASTPTPRATTPSATRSPSPTKPSSAAPVSLDNAVLDTSGLGPIKIGMTWDELHRNGWLEVSPDCPPHRVTSKQLQARGIDLRPDAAERLGDITLSSPRYATRSGAKVGMTVAEIERIYGAQLEREVKIGYQPYPTAFVRVGDREIVFAPTWETKQLTPQTRIEFISARYYSDHYMWDGC